jgi:hypothetical protein
VVNTRQAIDDTAQVAKIPLAASLPALVYSTFPDLLAVGLLYPQQSFLDMEVACGML